MDIKRFDIVLDNYKNPRIVVDEIKKYSKDISNSYNNASSIAELIYEIFNVEHKAQEYVWLISFTSDFHIIGVFEISHGSLNRSFFSAREIMLSALLSGAAQIVVAHCHPSGDISPSLEDDACTFNLYKLCKEMQVPLLDHIIVAENRGVMVYFSYAEDNRFDSV